MRTGLQIQPPTAHAGGALKVHHFSVKAVVQLRQAGRLPVALCIEARQLGVGPVGTGKAGVDGLEIAQHRAATPVFIAERKLQQPRQKRHAGAIRALCEVFKIGSVADVLGRNTQTPIARQFGGVGQSEAVAALAQHIVMGQKVAIERGAAVLRQQTQFTEQVQAAARVQRGLQGQIVVRCQVGIERCRDLQTATR